MINENEVKIFRTIVDSILSEFDDKKIPASIGIAALIDVIGNYAAIFMDEEQFCKVLDLMNSQFKIKKDKLYETGSISDLSTQD